MTPKEKANELIEKFKPNVYCYYGSGMLSDSYDEKAVLHYSKQCAIVAVDEIIEQINTSSNSLGNVLEQIAYWQSVKTELETLK